MLTRCMYASTALGHLEIGQCKTVYWPIEHYETLWKNSFYSREKERAPSRLLYVKINAGVICLMIGPLPDLAFLIAGRLYEGLTYLHWITMKLILEYGKGTLHLWVQVFDLEALSHLNWATQILSTHFNDRKSARPYEFNILRSTDGWCFENRQL